MRTCTKFLSCMTVFASSALTAGVSSFHCGVEVTESGTNEQHTLSLGHLD
jgi:hypothetical protein